MAWRTSETRTCNENGTRGWNHQPYWSVNLSVWDSHIQQIEGKKVLYCHRLQAQAALWKTPYHHSKHHSYQSTRAGHLPCWTITESTKLGLLSRHHELLSNYLSSVPQQIPSQKKNCENPGSRIVRCLHCNRAMLLKNCRLEMNINFHLEKQEQHLSVTAFPKIVGNFLSRGNFSIQGQHWRLDREVVVAQKCWVLSFLRITKLL